jgi:subtilisin-like proprotein convertase family protein
MSGNTSKVVVTLNGLTHTCGRDLDVLLVGPGGQKAMLMSDAGACLAISSGTNVTFDAAAAAAVPQSTAITTGTYRPVDYTIPTGSADTFPAPAPAAPWPADLAAFNGASPNGDWKLFVRDDAGGDVGTIAGGYSLTITTVASGGNTPPVVTNPGAQTTAVSTGVSLQVIASDADAGDTLSYSATGLPTGLTINGATGLISGTTAATAGSFAVTVTVSDSHPGGTASASFNWTVAAGGSGTQTFSAPGAITINDNASATPYPKSVTVSGMSGNTSKVVVTLNGLTHTCGRDLDVLLVGPGGQKAMLMSDAGACLAISSGTNVTFDAAAAAAVPQSTAITTGTYRPVDYTIPTGSADTFPAPAPAAPWPADLAAFNGASPNGDWKLFVRDDAGADVGTIAGGYSLTITTQ